MKNKIIRTEMSTDERATMKRMFALQDDQNIYETGFMAGKLSALTDILNNSTIYNGSITLSTNVGDKDSPAAGIPDSLE